MSEMRAALENAAQALRYAREKAKTSTKKAAIARALSSVRAALSAS